MELINKTKRLLSRPFPQAESWVGTVKIISAISAFIFFFLAIFKPFGMHLVEGSGFLLICAGFAMVAFFTSLAYEFMALKVFRIKGNGTQFTFGRWIIYFAGAILFISLANFIFARLTLFGYIQWSLYPPMMRSTFAIGLFPAIFFGGLALLQQERKYETIASAINQHTPYSSTADTKQSIFDIPVEQIRYVEAMQNYVKVAYVDTNNALREHTERATFTKVSSELLSKTILRCHRSFLVNRKFIASSTGNAQGLLLNLADCDKKIPVSRSYVAAFKV
jgi:hypothetical protein